MVSKREPHQKPWMAADEYGRSLAGFSFNLLVRSVPKAIAFQREVLGATVVYSDTDFAVLRRALPGGAGDEDRRRPQRHCRSRRAGCCFGIA